MGWIRRPTCAHMHSRLGLVFSDKNVDRFSATIAPTMARYRVRPFEKSTPKNSEDHPFDTQNIRVRKAEQFNGCCDQFGDESFMKEVTEIPDDRRKVKLAMTCDELCAQELHDFNGYGSLYACLCWAGLRVLAHTIEVCLLC